MFDDSLYDITGVCRHGLSVDLINNRFYLSLSCKLKIFLRQPLFTIIPWIQQKSGKNDIAISASVSAKELGEFILQQFNYIEEKRKPSLGLKYGEKNEY